MSERKGLRDVLIGTMTVAAIIIATGLLHSPSFSGLVGAQRTLSQSAPQASELLPPQEPKIVGLIESIDEQGITLKNYTVIAGTAAAPASTTAQILVRVGNTVAIERTMVKDIATIAKERDAYVAELVRLQKEEQVSTTTPTTPPEPPMPYSIEKLTLEDLRAGDSIVVFIGNSTVTGATVDATKIDAQPTPTSKPILAP